MCNHSDPQKATPCAKNIDVQIVKIGPPVFLHSSPFYPTQNPTLYNAFQLARHPQKCPFLSMHVH